MSYFCRGLGDTAEGRELSKAIADKLTVLNAKVAKALASKKSLATLDAKMEEVCFCDFPKLFRHVHKLLFIHISCIHIHERLG